MFEQRLSHWDILDLMFLTSFSGSADGGRTSSSSSVFIRVSQRQLMLLCCFISLFHLCVRRSFAPMTNALNAVWEALNEILTVFTVMEVSGNPDNDADLCSDQSLPCQLNVLGERFCLIRTQNHLRSSRLKVTYKSGCSRAKSSEFRNIKVT